MKRALVIALVCLSGVASAQPITISWRPPSGCSASQAIVWNGSAWTCGTVSTFSTSNVIPKGNGSGLTSSSVTDDGTTVATSENVNIGATFETGFAAGTPKFISSLAAGNPGLVVERAGASAGASKFFFYKTRGADAATRTALQTSDIIGTVQATGATDGSTAPTISSQIDFQVDDSVSGGVLPVAISLKTGSSASTTERLRIASNGSTTISAATVITAGTVVGTTNGLHFGFDSNIATIQATQPGTSYRDLNVETSRFKVNISGINTPIDVTSDLLTTTNFTATKNSQLGDASTDRVGIGVAPDSEWQMTFSPTNGNKIAIGPISATQMYGFGLQTGQLQYIAATSGNFHSFGYGDSDAFNESQRFDADGQVWMGDTANTAVSSNLDVLTIGNTGMGQTTSGISLVSASHSGSYDLSWAQFGNSQNALVLLTGTQSVPVWETSIASADGHLYGLKSVMTPTQTGECSFVPETSECTRLRVYGVYGEATPTSTSGVVTAYGGYFTAGGDGQAYALWTDDGLVNFEGEVTAKSTLTVNGVTQLHSTLLVAGAISDNDSDVTVDDGLKVTGAVDLDSTLNVDGATTHNAKVYFTGSAPALSTCGSGASISGNDTVGTITTGTGTVASCTVTFNAAYSTNAPVCITEIRSGMGSSWPYISAISTSAFTVTFGVDSPSVTWDYHCFGRL